MGYFGKWDNWKDLPATTRALSFTKFLQDNGHLPKGMAIKKFNTLFIKKETWDVSQEP